MAARRKVNRPGRIRQTVAAGEALGSLVRTLGTSPLGLGLAWAQVSDERLRARARPLRLERGRLVLLVQEAAWAAEVQRNEAAILQRLGEVLGAGKVRKLEVLVARGDP